MSVVGRREMFSSSLIRFIFRRRKLLLLIIFIFFCIFIYAVQIHHSFDDLDLRRSDGSNSSLLSSSLSSSNDSYNGSLADIQARLVKCIGFFLKRYTAYCSAHVRPRYPPLNETSDSQLCPCIPNNLVGFFPINETEVASLEELESAAAEEEEEDGGATEEKDEDGTSPSWKENGRWRPSWCVARQRVAIIVPYADRDRHLRIFLRHMHPLLQRQLIDFNIFIIEQLYPELFNRAALMNVGFVEARRNWTTTTTNDDDDDDDDDRSSSCSRCKRRPFDCFIFHDIDQLPIDDRNFYVCSEFPRHVVGYRKKFDYGYAYSTSFGGGNSFTEEEFQLINGFSNIFYGWGGEDDDLYQRTVAMNMSRTRYPRCIARYDEVTHARDKRNPRGVNQLLGFKLRPDAYRQDGLTNLNYTVESIQRSKLFTKISVRLPPPPPPSPDSAKGHGWLNLIRLMLGIQEENLYEENL